MGYARHVALSLDLVVAALGEFPALLTLSVCLVTSRQAVGVSLLSLLICILWSLSGSSPGVQLATFFVTPAQQLYHFAWRTAGFANERLGSMSNLKGDKK